MPFAAEHTASTAATYSATFMRLLPLNFVASRCKKHVVVWWEHGIGGRSFAYFVLVQFLCCSCLLLLHCLTAHWAHMSPWLADWLTGWLPFWHFEHFWACACDVNARDVMFLLLALSYTFSCRPNNVVDVVHPLPQPFAFDLIFALLHAFFHYVFDWIHFLESHLCLFICCHSSILCSFFSLLYRIYFVYCIYR